MTLLIILAVLFVALIIVVPLIEKYGQKQSDESLHKLTRWIFPLLLLLLILQGLRYIL